MENVLGVRFQEAGKIYYFSSAGHDDLEAGEYVVVETSRGQELARVIIAPGQVLSAELTEPLKAITRVAYDEDIEKAEQLRKKAEGETEIARQKARDAGLAIKVFSGSYDLEGRRLTLLFTSEDRIDFRDLVRDVSIVTGAQVQLRQVGPRDQAKVVGGYGRCGRRLCCSSWLVSFPAISIKMAKEQDLPLNPSKISGQCGRLLCCLSYENETYREIKQALPRPGTYLSTPNGNARVLAVNVPRGVVSLQMETMETVDVPIQDLGMDRGLVRILPGPPPPTVVLPVRQPAAGVARAPGPPPQGAARGAPERLRDPQQRPQLRPDGNSPPPVRARPLRPVIIARPTPATEIVEPPAAAGTVPSPPGAGPAGHRRRRRRGGRGPRPQPPQ